MEDGDDDAGGLNFDEEVDAEDEQYIEAAEQYEAQYNFRYEEPGAAQIITYPRKVWAPTNPLTNPSFWYCYCEWHPDKAHTSECFRFLPSVHGRY